jgi:hypothetical protein
VYELEVEVELGVVEEEVELTVELVVEVVFFLPVKLSNKFLVPLVVSFHAFEKKLIKGLDPPFVRLRPLCLDLGIYIISKEIIIYKIVLE